MFYIGLAVGLMFGGMCGVVYMALVIIGKQSDDRIPEMGKGFDERV